MTTPLGAVVPTLGLSCLRETAIRSGQRAAPPVLAQRATEAAAAVRRASECNTGGESEADTRRRARAEVPARRARGRCRDHVGQATRSPSRRAASPLSWTVGTRTTTNSKRWRCRTRCRGGNSPTRLGGVMSTPLEDVAHWGEFVGGFSTLVLLDHILDGPRGGFAASTLRRHSGQVPSRRSSTCWSCRRTSGSVHGVLLRGEKRSAEREESVADGA